MLCSMLNYFNECNKKQTHLAQTYKSHISTNKCQKEGRIQTTNCHSSLAAHTGFCVEEEFRTFKARVTWSNTQLWWMRGIFIHWSGCTALQQGWRLKQTVCQEGYRVQVYDHRAWWGSGVVDSTPKGQGWSQSTLVQISLSHLVWSHM